jgi:hypothetical protein
MQAVPQVISTIQPFPLAITRASSDFQPLHVYDDAVIMQYSSGTDRSHDAKFPAKDRAADRERSSMFAASLIHSFSLGTEASSVPQAAGTQFCIILRAPCPSIARAVELVHACSDIQGGGACAVMAVQADGQVCQFSVTAASKLAPLRKSKCVH